MAQITQVGADDNSSLLFICANPRHLRNLRPFFFEFQVNANELHTVYLAAGSAYWE